MKILQRLPAFVVAIVTPFGRPSDAAVERDDQAGIGLVVVERPVAGGAQHAIAHGYTGITNQRNIQTQAAIVTVFDVERPVGGE